tara:strand:+ start:3939 stop:4184 length:246 start_codon:yes stop_codon:yes gene_type:complete
MTREFGPLEFLAFAFIIWWTASTIIRNHRWFKAIRITYGRSSSFDFARIIELLFLRSAIRREDKEWAEKVIEEEKDRRGTK